MNKRIVKSGCKLLSMILDELVVLIFLPLYIMILGTHLTVLQLFNMIIALRKLYVNINSVQKLITNAIQESSVFKFLKDFNMEAL